MQFTILAKKERMDLGVQGPAFCLSIDWTVNLLDKVPEASFLKKFISIKSGTTVI